MYSFALYKNPQSNEKLQATVRNQVELSRTVTDWVTVTNMHICQNKSQD